MQAVIAEFEDDPGFYRGLLKRLLVEYGPARIDWQAPLRDEAAQETMRARLHKLSGSAAVLRAHRLAALAKESEGLLQHDGGPDRSQLDQRLSAIGLELERIEQSARQWLRAADGSPTDASALDAKPPDPSTLNDWIAALHAQDLQALTRFQTLKPTLNEALPSEGFAAVQEAIEGLDFARALEVLGQYELTELMSVDVEKA